jgi:ketosteroid isomerase-like protein
MSPARMSRIESAMRVVLSFNDAFNRHDIEAMLNLISDDCRIENPGPAPDGSMYSGKDAIKEFWKEFFHSSTQAYIEIEDIFGFGMHCIMRWKYNWTDAEEKKQHLRGVDIFKVRDGLICEKLGYVKG